MTEFVQGIPVPYTVRTDDVLTALVFFSSVFSLVAVAYSKDFIKRHFKLLFRRPSFGTSQIPETATEVRFQFFLGFQTCLFLALLVLTYILDNSKDAANATSYYAHFFTIVGGFVAYFLAKAILQGFVNWVYFEPSENRHWQKSQLFLTALEGAQLFPIVLLLCYFSMSFQKALILTILVVIFVKIIAFYRCYVTFFDKKRFWAQIFLYFCTLEIIPLLAFYGVMSSMIDV